MQPPNAAKHHWSRFVRHIFGDSLTQGVRGIFHYMHLGVHVFTGEASLENHDDGDDEWRFI